MNAFFKSDEKILIEFFLTGVCRHNNHLEEMSYSFQWKKFDFFGLGKPIQKVEFKSISANEFNLLESFINV